MLKLAVSRMGECISASMRFFQLPNVSYSTAVKESIVEAYCGVAQPILIDVSGFGQHLYARYVAICGLRISCVLNCWCYLVVVGLGHMVVIWVMGIKSDLQA